MRAIRLTDMKEILYAFAVKFDKFSPEARITFAVCYSIIIIIGAILNGAILYVFVTKSSLRRPLKLVLSLLLWKSIFLLLTAMPVTLLELCIEVVRRNRYLVAIQNYLTMFYIWLSFYIVIHIGLNRVRAVRQKFSISSSKQSHYGLLFFIIGTTISALMPITTIALYHYKGKKASTLFSCTKVLIMTLVLLVSYGMIIKAVKKSNRGWKARSNSKRLLQQNKRMLRKVKHTVHLVIGGYALTLVPFICSSAVESYIYYKRDPAEDNNLFLYTFRAVGEMVLYLNIIFNPIIYFYTQTDLMKDVGRLRFAKGITLRLQSSKTSKNTCTDDH